MLLRRLGTSARIGVAAFVAGLVLLFVAFVALANQEDGSVRAQDANVAQAEAALGRSLPQVTTAVAGLKRSGIGIDPPEAPLRAVHVSYAIDGSNVVLLNIGKAGTVRTQAQETIQLPGHSASVVTQLLGNGTTDVSYAWSDTGYFYALHVNLSHGLTRTVADQIAASIR
ncbi:MAG: hypothetical protein M3T56_18335 [Chloroflexota bacterium]|nr:hypothetical protein [Chloroflexota bacterium]